MRGRGYFLIAMKINIHMLFPFVVQQEMRCQKWQFKLDVRVSFIIECRYCILGLKRG